MFLGALTLGGPFGGIHIIDFHPKSLLIGYLVRVYDFQFDWDRPLHILLNPHGLGIRTWTEACAEW